MWKKHKSSTVVIFSIVLLVALYNLGTIVSKSINSVDVATLNGAKSVLTSEDEKQGRCRLSSEQAFNNFSGTFEKALYSKIILGSEKDFTLLSKNNSYKYNYNSSLNLCFIQYIFNWKIKDNASGNDGEFTIKYGDTLLSGTIDPVNSNSVGIANLVVGTSPSGSQVVILCTIQKPGHYDDISKKTYIERMEPTECTSESEFDSLVKERMGIK